MDLECPSSLEPHLQQLLGEEETSPADVGDSLLQLPTPEDPEPSTLHASDWIEWHTRYVQMPSWWEELTKIPCHADHQEFAQKVCASFEVPKAYNQAKKVDNYHAQLLVHPSISKYHFLPPRDVKFTQDIHLTQLHHTITYARALQHWAKEVHPLVPSHLFAWQGVVQELQWAMEPLITFAEGDVFMIMVLSKWMEITSAQSTKAMPQESPKSHTQSSRACPRGYMSVTCSEGWPATTAMQATTKAEALTTPPWGFMLHQPTSDSKLLCPPPGFTEIT